MALVLKDVPVGVDKAVSTIQKALYTTLVTNGSWLNYESYHRAYRNETKKGIKPEIFSLEGNDYRDAFMSDKFTVTSFFLTAKSTPVSENMHTSNISVIFQVDLNKLYPTSPHRFDEEFKNEIVKVFRGLGGAFKYIDTVTDLADVYAGLDISQVQLDDTHPRHVVRFELTANYMHQCGIAFATTDCTIRVDEVTTTPETTAGANDGTATVVTLGGQGNLTYLWNDPLEQTTVTATGLGAGIFTVTVTDDNVLIPACTDSGSGTVVVAPPLPTCNLIILTVTNTPPTSFGASDGTATVTFSGNVGIAAILWDDGQTTATATGLLAGAACVGVLDLDIDGCQAVGETTLAEGTKSSVAPEDLDNMVFNIDAGVQAGFNAGSITDGTSISQTNAIAPATEGMTQVQVARQTTWFEDGLGSNDLPRINFAAASSQSLQSVYSQAGSYTAIIVFRLSSNLDAGNLMDNLVSGGSGFRLQTDIQSGNMYLQAGTNSVLQSHVAPSTVMNPPAVSIVALTVNNITGEITIKLNNGTLRSNTQAIKNVSFLTLGAKASGITSENFDGDMGQYVLYSDEKTETERDMVVEHLRIKFGLTF